MVYDVIVIGASSAGLYAAELLAKAGKQVAIMERSEKIQPKNRTYIITPGLFRAMPDISSDLIRHKIDLIQLQAGDARAEVRLFSPDLTLERNQIIIDLFKHAKSLGVDFKLGVEFLGVENRSGITQIKYRENGKTYSARAKYLIGADGMNSKVNETVFKQNTPAVPLLQAEIMLPDDWDETVSKVWFQVDDSPYFYWLIPDRHRKAVVGLIAESGADIKKLLKDFLEAHDFQAIEYQSGSAAMYTKGQKVETNVGDLKVYLVGDAAGQVKVTTVGGSVTGFAGAKAVAEAILSGSSYRKTMKSLQRELSLHLLIRKLLEKMSERDYEKMIVGLSPSVQSFLSKYDRDQMRFHFWKLPFLQPAYIPLGIKLLLKTIFQ